MVIFDHSPYFFVWKMAAWTFFGRYIMNAHSSERQGAILVVL